ncbi:variable surface lipoprotein [Mycoplasma phocoeninasale]|uniref:Variable surface lipoprotein n=1 Tax=Mycoplasma phocoeninasale TaxID=2726117 RepID=A0A858U008_9MOLU|nr:variable surface lipoprotein [Mycoplasma phocoeninasale]QJG66394.1 variable surface lipoprotein [Mycoplasma phocoeninasale]
MKKLLFALPFAISALPLVAASCDNTTKKDRDSNVQDNKNQQNSKNKSQTQSSVADEKSFDNINYPAEISYLNLVMTIVHQNSWINFALPGDKKPKITIDLDDIKKLFKSC